MISFLLGLLLAAPAADPGGFLSAKWGMTEEQILAAFPNEATRLNPPEKFVNPARSASIVIRRSDRSIFFICEPTLQGVIIQFFDDSPEQFLRAEAQLVQHYGRPWHRATSEIEQSQWSFVTTIITLRRIAFRNIPMRWVDLTYQRRQAPEL
jgi:hypothetical protein